MIKLIDTHAHIYLDNFADDIAGTIKESYDAGIEQIFMPNIDSKSIQGMLELENKFTNYCLPMMGLHPCSVKENYLEELKVVESWLKKRKFYGLGEVGIDLYWDKSYYKEQIKAFEIQISWAKDYSLPIIIHCRESLDITIDIIEKHQDGTLNGIFHCFSGDLEQAKRIVDANFLLGLGGVVTFKNSGLDKVVPKLQLEYIVLETDSPYLAPVPKRGNRNEPANLVHVAKRVSDLMDISIEEVGLKTTQNARALFTI